MAFFWSRSQDGRRSSAKATEGDFVLKLLESQKIGWEMEQGLILVGFVGSEAMRSRRRNWTGHDLYCWSQFQRWSDTAVAQREQVTIRIGSEGAVHKQGCSRPVSAGNKSVTNEEG